MSPRIRLIQCTLVDGDVAGNLDKILKAIAESAGKTDLLIFPETCISGFPAPENISQLAEPLGGTSVTAVRAAAKTAGVAVAIGMAEVENGRFFNAGLLIDSDGEVRLRYRKTNLYDSDKGVFEPGAEFPVCQWHGIRLGMLICFDIEFPEPARVLGQKGVDLIVLLDGMMQPYQDIHRNAIPVRAMDNQLYIAMTNRVGQGDQYRFSGESHVAGPFGQTVAIAKSEGEAVIDVVLDMNDVKRARAASSREA